MKHSIRLVSILFLVAFMISGLAAQTASTGKTGAKSPSTSTSLSQGKTPSPLMKTWYIHVNDTQPNVAPDGTKNMITMDMSLTCQSIDGSGTYTGTSTLSSVGNKAGFGASLAMVAKNVSINVVLREPATPPVPLKPPSGSATAGTATKVATDEPQTKDGVDLDPLAPLVPLDYPVSFSTSGQISYVWTKLRDSLMLEADNKPSASDKAAFTFTFDYTLKTPPYSTDYPAKGVVLMTMTVAGEEQVNFRGRMGVKSKTAKKTTTKTATTVTTKK